MDFPDKARRISKIIFTHAARKHIRKTLASGEVGSTFPTVPSLRESPASDSEVSDDEGGIPVDDLGLSPCGQPTKMLPSTRLECYSFVSQHTDLCSFWLTRDASVVHNLQ